jgi:hypothetical protein
MSHTTEFTCKYCGKDTTVEGLADIPVCPACQASLASRARGVSAGCSDRNSLYRTACRRDQRNGGQGGAGVPRSSYNVSPFRGTRHRRTEYIYARTGQPTVFLRGYGPQLGNPAKHRDAQSRHTPARQRANALRVLRPTALLAPCRIPTPPPGHEASAPPCCCRSLMALFDSRRVKRNTCPHPW